MTPEIQREVISILRSRCGRDQAITTEQICEAVGLPATAARTMRLYLRELRFRDDLGEFPLVGIGGVGWFLASNVDEWMDRGNWLRDNLVQGVEGLVQHFRHSFRHGLPVPGLEPLRVAFRKLFAKNPKL